MDLINRARLGDLEGVKRLIQQRVNVNAINRSYQTALYFACERGHAAMTEYLLDNGADVNRGAKPLIAAARYNRYDCAKFLLQHNANIYCTNKKLETPMSVASQKQNYAIILLLLQYNAMPPASLSDVTIQLLKCATVEHTKVIQKLINEKIIDLMSEDTFLAAFSFAFQRGSVELAERMLLNDCYPKIEQLYPYAVFFGAKNNWPSVLSKLTEKRVDVNVLTGGQTPLYVACKESHESVVTLLLNNGADPNVPNKLTDSASKDFTLPLQIVVQRRNAAIFNLLLEKGANKLDPEPMLHMACSRDAASKTADEAGETRLVEQMLSIIRPLLQHGVNVNAISEKGDTALYRACKSGHLQVVQVLLEAGAETETKLSRPLYVACENGYTHIVGLLLQHGANPNACTYRPNLPIFYAIKKGYIDIVELLLKHGADASKHDQSGKSALLCFVESLASEVYKTSRAVDPLEGKSPVNILKRMLLTAGDVNKLSDRDGRNALHVASSFGMCDVITGLTEHGANCNHLTSSGKSALDLAVENGHEAAVETLLKNGAKPDRETAATFRHVNYDSRKSAMPVLCTAAENGSETMVKMLLQYGPNVNASDTKGNTALHLATSHSVIEMLLTAGANVNATNDNGDTAVSIGLAYEKRQTDMTVIEMFLKFGADPNKGFLLHAACKNDDLDVVQLLLKYGADANRFEDSVAQGGRTLRTVDTKSSPLCIACKNGNVATVGCLLKNGADATFVDSSGNSLLCLAVHRLKEQENSEDPIIALLLKYNAAVDVVANTGETPLYMACMKGLTGVVKQLLDCRADVGLTTSNPNKYPLLIACQKKFRDIAMMLLEHGADANVTKDRQTPLKLAAANGDVVLVEQLITCRAYPNQIQNIGDTALHVAVRQRSNFGNEALVKIVCALLKSGADVNVLNDGGETPLYLACSIWRADQQEA